MNDKVADKITNQILNLIAAGVNPWKKGWASSTISPFNAESGRRYNGLNALICGCYTPAGRVPAFTTFNKYAEVPRIAKKGSKSIALIRPMIVKETVAGIEREKMVGIGYVNVFSVYDIEGYDVATLEKKYLVEGKNHDTIAEAEAIIAAMPNAPKISFGGNRAFYSPSSDSVTVPELKAFESVGEYYSTMFHELGHSTGHLSRLDRKDGMNDIRFGSTDYGREELIAELCACFVGSEIGLKDDSSLKNSASYLKGWLKPLQDDPRMIIQASSAATKAANYILNKKPDEAKADDKAE